MPPLVLPANAELGTFISPNTTGAAPNTTQVLNVICEFPLSGQYGPGSRFLYYVLIAACVFGRKGKLAPLAMKVCLVAALVFPAVAAIHGIVLAALHRDGVVDMDVFGAFQLCAIGILAAPVTVKLSSTYFNNPGRNFIFVWTILILIGLLSLTVEFDRSNVSLCPNDDLGQPLSPDPRLFNYNNPPSCNLTCSTTLGPFSPIRQGSANNIYVVPAPESITFGRGLLLGAGCCIPAILYLVSMWSDILKLNWKSRYDNRDKKALIPGTNGATLESMTKVDDHIDDFLKIPEALLFSIAILFIVVVGEMNFMSGQVSWQTEPMSAIGQWAQVVGTILAVLGMLYHVHHDKKESNPTASKPPSPAKHENHKDNSPAPFHDVATSSISDGRHGLLNRSGRTSTEAVISSLPPAVLPTGGKPPLESLPTMNMAQRTATWRSVLSDAGDLLVNGGPEQFDDLGWRNGQANSYPRSPGQENKDKDLYYTEKHYTGNVTQLRKQNSRAGSITGSTNPGLGVNVDDDTRLRAPSPGRSRRRSRSSASRSSQVWVELQNVTSQTSAGSNGDMPKQQSTLDHPQHKEIFDNNTNQSPSPPG